MRDAAPVGVLIMAYGGPGKLSDIPGYLADIRGNRPTPASVTLEISRNYEAIGGSSPLLECTTRQATVIASELAAESGDFRVYMGMRHWSPWIEDTVGEM